VESSIETAQLLNILNNNTNCNIDKIAIIRQRLFDMFVNDWNRGEDKWRWEKQCAGCKQGLQTRSGRRVMRLTQNTTADLQNWDFNITNASLIPII
jgi:hypothetical protein